MESVFHARPVIPNILEPAFEGMSLRQSIGDVVTGFDEGLAVTGTGVMNAQCTTCMREVYLGGFDVDPANTPRFVATMGLADDIRKKGDALVR